MGYTEITMKPRIIPEIGDLIEIKTPEGLAYVQYTAKHTDPPVFGELIRILPGLYKARPDDFSVLANQKERYFVFTPITRACRKKWATIVSNEVVPEWAQGIPLMRMANQIDSNGEGRDWYLWDGVKSWPANDADVGQLSIASIWGHEVLVEKLAEGWLPSDNYSGPDELPEVSDTSEIDTGSELTQVRHYLYFPSQALANTAAQTLETKEYTVKVEPRIEQNNWLVQATMCVLLGEEVMNEHVSYLKSLASSSHGDYDGWDVLINGNCS